MANTRLCSRSVYRKQREARRTCSYVRRCSYVCPTRRPNINACVVPLCTEAHPIHVLRAASLSSYHARKPRSATRRYTPSGRCLVATVRGVNSGKHARQRELFAFVSCAWRLRGRKLFRDTSAEIREIRSATKVDLKGRYVTLVRRTSPPLDITLLIRWHFLPFDESRLTKRERFNKNDDSNWKHLNLNNSIAVTNVKWSCIYYSIYIVFKWARVPREYKKSVIHSLT